VAILENGGFRFNLKMAVMQNAESASSNLKLVSTILKMVSFQNGGHKLEQI